MAIGTKTSRLKRTVSDQSLIAGLQKHESVIPSLLIGGVQTPTSSMIGTLQGRLNAVNATIAAKATWQAAVEAERNERETTNVFVNRVRQALNLAFADQVDTLADFGLTPRKKAAVRPATKVNAAVKAKATREARHTLGPKQKKAIHGTVPEAVPSGGGAQAPATAPAAASAPGATATAPIAAPPGTPATKPAS